MALFLKTSNGFLRHLKTFGIVLNKKKPLEGFWSLQKPLEAIGSHKKFLALSLKASNGFEGLLKTSKGL